MTALARMRVPLLLLWFVGAFGVICLIPWHPSKSGKWLPLGTPYVNGGLAYREGRLLLGTHLAAALLFAAAVEVSRRSVGSFRRTGHRT
jgi:hypothetical protein